MIFSQKNTSVVFPVTFLGSQATRPSVYPKHLKFSGLLMKSIFKALFFLCALSLAFPVFAQPDFEATKARAEAGDANAQNNLGAMYDNGTGVAENVQEAVKWYRLAAEQGDANSQFVLGLMYENGEGVSGNDVRAYIWYSVAAAQGAAYAEEYRDNVKAVLSPQALEQAQAMASRCFESNYKDCD